MFSVWCIENFGDQDVWYDRVHSVETFTELVHAQEYCEILEELDSASRSDSRNPDWGFSFFVQETEKSCYAIYKSFDDEPIELDEEPEMILLNEELAKETVTHLQKMSKHQKYEIVKLIPFYERESVKWGHMIFEEAFGHLIDCNGENCSYDSTSIDSDSDDDHLQELYNRAITLATKYAINPQ